MNRSIDGGRSHRSIETRGSESRVCPTPIPGSTTTACWRLIHAHHIYTRANTDPSSPTHIRPHRDRGSHAAQRRRLVGRVAGRGSGAAAPAQVWCDGIDGMGSIELSCTLAWRHGAPSHPIPSTKVLTLNRSTPRPHTTHIPTRTQHRRLPPPARTPPTPYPPRHRRPPRRRIRQQQRQQRRRRRPKHATAPPAAAATTAGVGQPEAEG